MGKKKKEIAIKDIKSVKLKIDLSVSKEQFDELLRMMAHIESGNKPQEDTPKKGKKKET